MNHSYFTPLSYKDQLQTLEQAQTVSSIRHIIKNMNLVIRVTDKSHNFYIGLASEFEKKVENFFQDTNAFTELSYNPFNETLDKVLKLLDKFQSEKRIYQWQYKKMVPDRTKVELPHLYFNPKTHKVQLNNYFLLSFKFIQLYSILKYRRVYQFGPLRIPFLLQQEIFQNI